MRNKPQRRWLRVLGAAKGAQNDVILPDDSRLSVDTATTRQ